MPWFKVDDRLYSHPKWLAASMPARGLWTTAGSWCAGNSHDGLVPPHALKLLGGTRRHATELVTVGLWEVEGDGWRFHDWCHFQPSTEQVEADRQAARERQRRARQRAASRRDSGVSHGSVTVPPTRPDPTPLVTTSLGLHPLPATTATPEADAADGGTVVPVLTIAPEQVDRVRQLRRNLHTPDGAA
jgi:hypothetical protein